MSGDLESHHPLQGAWAQANLSGFGYSYGKAPTITLERGQGLAHGIISERQTARLEARIAAGKGPWSTSLQEELQYTADDFRAAGFSEETISRTMETQYEMLRKLKVPFVPVQVVK